MPSYLKGYEVLYRRDPRVAAHQWFKDAKFGLFMHYGLYGLLGRGEWMMLRERIPIAEYTKLKAQFTAENFDADFITGIAIEVGMKYINITTRHHGPIAGIWFDPIMGYYHRPDLFPIEETYALIRSLQPLVLISFKQGAGGDEDFATPERSTYSLASRLEDPGHQTVAQEAWGRNKDKHSEINDTLQPHVWRYRKPDDGKHHGPSELMQMLKTAWAKSCNLLLNTGPLPDGSIHAADVSTLREVGRRLRGGELGDVQPGIIGRQLDISPVLQQAIAAC